jgi:two-component system, sensor histidine kinase and response regulator
VNKQSKNRLNMNELLARTENDRELATELLLIFVDEFPSKLANLRDALAREDLPQVAITSHALKGMLSNLAVSKAASSAAKLEQSARSGQKASVHEAFGAFQQDTEGLVPEVQAQIEEARR